MTISFEFDTIEARDTFAQDTPPEGLSFYAEAANEGGVVASTFILFAEIIKPIAAGIIARWIYDRVAKSQAKRVRVDGREAVDRSEFERMIANGLEASPLSPPTIIQALADRLYNQATMDNCERGQYAEQLVLSALGGGWKWVGAGWHP
jgi:hypothetical protein